MLGTTHELENRHMIIGIRARHGHERHEHRGLTRASEEIGGYGGSVER